MDERMQVFRDCSDYDAVRNLDEDIQIACYSRKEFERRHENGGYLLSGIIGKGAKEECGKLHLEDDVLPIYRCTYNKHLYEPYGYVLCEDDTYLVILQLRIRKFLLLFLLLALLLLFGLFLYRGMGRSGPDLEPGTRDFKAAQKLSDDYGETRIIIPAFQPLNVRAGDTGVKTVLWNPEKNQVYFQFQLVLKNTQEVIYESRLVPPGQAIYELSLKRSIDAGVYPLIVRVSTYDIEEYEQQMNGGEVETSLNVVKDTGDQK